MKKTYLICTILLLLIAFAVYYFYPMTFSQIIKSYVGVFTPNEIDASVYFSALSSKDFKMKDNNLINELFMFLENIKVRKIIMNPSFYSPKLMNTYMLTIHSQEGKYLWIYIMDDKYIRIEGEVYRIVDEVDLSKIYELILLDQDEDSINEFYFNLLEER